MVRTEVTSPVAPAVAAFGLKQTVSMATASYSQLEEQVSDSECFRHFIVKIDSYNTFYF